MALLGYRISKKESRALATLIGLATALVAAIAMAAFLVVWLCRMSVAPMSLQNAISVVDKAGDICQAGIVYPDSACTTGLYNLFENGNSNLNVNRGFKMSPIEDD